MEATSTDQKPAYLPIQVTAVDQAFGGKAMEILPPMSKIPKEFCSGRNEWCEWQSRWFYEGLKELPSPREGIDAALALKSLKCVQGSFEPKHEHKAAGVAYLASLWFASPNGGAA